MKRNEFLFLLVGLGVFAMTTIKLSRHGLNKIKKHEALRLIPYKDAAGYWTIGYGHKLIFPRDQWVIDKGSITEDQAENFLREDSQIAQDAVNHFVQVPLTGNQFDALVSFVYNVGINAFKESTLLNKLNSKDYMGAANEFKRWKYAGGDVLTALINRREEEKQLFLT